MRPEYAAALVLDLADMRGDAAPAQAASSTERARRAAVRDCLET
jgi:hypothetical protein